MHISRIFSEKNKKKAHNFNVFPLIRKMEQIYKILEYYDMFDNKYQQFIHYLDNEVSKNLKNGGIETRLQKSNGLWCFAVLPTILILYHWTYKVSLIYSLTAYISFGLLVQSVLFIIFISVSSLVFKEGTYGGCMASSILSSLLIYIFLEQDVLVSLLVTFLSIYLFNALLRHVITNFPKTFTFGEAMILTQGIVLFAVASTLKFGDGDGDNITLIINVVYAVLTSVVLMITILSFLDDDDRNMEALLYTIVAGAVFFLALLSVICGVTCIWKLFIYIFLDYTRVQLVFFWLILVATAVFIILLGTKRADKADTVTRKSFHVLASLVFLSGILCDPNLMRLAAGVGMGLLIFVEFLRKSNIEPISSGLHSAFLVYSDDKDCGSFAMTPIYLFVGLACPLALVPPHQNDTLELLSGVLAIGVGDTAASWFGSRYGTNKWPGGNRTIEGTLFNILSQVSTVYILEIFEILIIQNSVPRTAIAATISSLVEARTNQVDNLILPFVNILSFQLTSCLS